MDKKPEQIAKPWFLNRSFFGFFFPVVILYFHLGGEWAVLIPRDVGMFWLALAAPLKSPLPAEMIPAFEICFIGALPFSSFTLSKISMSISNATLRVKQRVIRHFSQK